jgi:hypothetical protein
MKLILTENICVLYGKGLLKEVQHGEWMDSMFLPNVKAFE